MVKKRYLLGDCQGFIFDDIRNSTIIPIKTDILRVVLFSLQCLTTWLKLSDVCASASIFHSLTPSTTIPSRSFPSLTLSTARYFSSHLMKTICLISQKYLQIATYHISFLGINDYLQWLACLPINPMHWSVLSFLKQPSFV